jgi:hypothetical protein
MNMEVRRSNPLARTELALVGGVDGAAVARLREAIADALAQGHDVWVDVDDITSVKRSVVGDLRELAVWMRKGARARRTPPSAPTPKRHAVAP